MKSKSLYFILILGILFLGNCKKQEDAFLCTTDRCVQYETIWKNILLEQGGIDQGYFDDHVKPLESLITTDEDGEYFDIRYRVEIDWAEIEVRDQFIFRINENSIKYDQLTVPRGELLNEDEIREVLSIAAFQSNITTVGPVTSLSVKSNSKAKKEMKDLGGKDVEIQRISYFENVSGALSDGFPYMFGVTPGASENDCTCSRLNLATGEGTTDICGCQVQ
ncbi:MAG: hypothetical protein MRY83_21915 [Flavobacteriales bacterium]|nr:hypothetical protein [Flavobacteriales bacterium]